MPAPHPSRAPDPPIDPFWQEAIRSQLGAAIDTLENAIRVCPQALWADRSRRPEYWYLAYHTLFFLDLYLAGSVDGFRPPEPFTLDELDPAGVMPERPYTQAELLDYLEHCRGTMARTIAALTGAAARRRCAFSWGEPSFAELLLNNLRHVQHHAAQMNLILRRETGSAPGWVSGA